VARRYANALFSVAQKRGKEDEVAKILTSLKEKVQADPELQWILKHPLLPMEEKERILEALFPQLDPLMKNFFPGSVVQEEGKDFGARSF